MYWITLTQDMAQLHFYEHRNESSGAIDSVAFLDRLSDNLLFKKAVFHGVM
jgi:hypothetical protein